MGSVGYTLIWVDIEAERIGDGRGGTVEDFLLLDFTM